MQLPCRYYFNAQCKTKRGCRAGTRKQKQITTIVRSRPPTRRHFGRSHNTLTKINIPKITSECSRSVKTINVTVKNCDSVKPASNDKLLAKNSLSKTQTQIKSETNKFSAILKEKFRIGTWNVRSMKDEKLGTIIKEAKRNNIKVLGFAEHRWAKAGHFRTEDGGNIYYSGNKNAGQGGVGFWVDRSKLDSIIGYKPINGRMMSIRIRGATKNLKIIQTYAPTSKAKPEEIEDFYKDLQKEIDETNKSDIISIIGDFNAKVGTAKNENEKGIVGTHSYGGRNANGEEFVDFAISNNIQIMNTFFNVHRRRLFTWTAPDGISKHQIDYITIQKEHSEIVRGTRTLPGADCGTDHELLIADMKFKLRSKKRSTPVVKYEMNEINDQYAIAIKNRFSVLTTICEEKEPEDLANEIRDIFREEASLHLKKKRKKKQPWISRSTLDKIEQRRSLKSQKNKTEGNNEYRKIHKEIKQLCKKDKQQYYEMKCKKIEEFMKTNKTREMFKEIESLTKKKTQNLNVIKDAVGNPLTEDNQIAERWVEYCKDMYKADANEGCTYQTDKTVNEELPPPLLSEVRNAIKSLKKNKSPGEDQINAEMIIAGGEEAISIYHKLITKVWNTEKWPKDWKSSVYVPLFKKGDPQQCSNYRTISLISHASKIMLKIIMDRISKTLDQEVANNQAGFRKNRGTRDHLFNLTTIIQKHNEMNNDLRICFIDYSKAFDCVNHKKLWQSLEELNFHPKIISLIKSLYQNQTATVQLESGKTDSFEVGKGVRQGCILSPHLFSLYTENIMRKVEEDNRSDNYDEVIINGHKIRDLRYADDTALMSTTAAGLTTLVEATKHHSEAYNLNLNIKKTKIMDTDKCISKTNIVVDGENIENVDSFEYLGARFERDGTSKNEIKRRIAIAKQKINKMKATWKGLSIDIKTRIINTCIFPLVLYGCEAWTVLQSDLKKLEAFEMYCYRRILGISWKEKITNENVRKRLGLKSGYSYLGNQMKKQKLSFFGHTKRHDSLEKLIMEGKVCGKKGRGRPRKQWKDDVKNWLGKDLTTAGRIAQNRKEYRKCVWAATSHKTTSQDGLRDMPQR